MNTLHVIYLAIRSCKHSRPLTKDGYVIRMDCITKWKRHVLKTLLAYKY